MGKGIEIRSFDYVSRPYERVRDALKGDAAAVFQAATTVAAKRAQSVVSALRVEVGGVEVAADVEISVDRIEERAATVTAPPSTTLHLSWAAARLPGLFPLMTAEFSIYPLTGKETQLDFSGRYAPPLGPLGEAIDAVAGHRIAEASVHRFVTDVADYLRRTLAESKP